ncbi:MAG: DivIVA domain-containing protein [Bacillota bacterium]
MSITPMDIQEKEFERAFRGYDIEDVDDFLDQIATDLEGMIRENSELKEKLSQMEEKNKNYHKLEETMHNAIVVAQETADEVKNNAKREAELIRREAEREAKQVVEDARKRAGRILSEQEELFKQAQLFKMRFRAFIEAQLSNLDSEDWMDLSGQDQDQELSEMTREFEVKMNESITESEDENKEKPDNLYAMNFQPDFKSEPEPAPESGSETDTDFEVEPEKDLEPEPEFQLGPDDDYDRDPEF